MVYNSKTVYNEPGGGVVTDLPDIAINGKIFKNFFPISTYADPDIISSNMIMKNFLNTPLLWGGSNFQLSSNDTFVIQFTVSRASFTNQNCTVFGSSTGTYNNLTLDFGDANKSVFVGVPRSTSPNSWTDFLVLGALQLTANKFYTVKIICDNSNITLSLNDDNGYKSATQNKNNLSANSPIQLFGLNRINTKPLNGLIDLSKSYIKKNGVLIWGIEE